MKSITDRAEVSIDFPDKAYMGAFGRESAFDVKVEADEVMLRIVRTGDDRREIAVHLHYYLLADILKALGQGLVAHDFLDEAHLKGLREGADALVQALKEPAKAGGRKK
jgi:hypothetical protein